MSIADAKKAVEKEKVNEVRCPNNGWQYDKEVRYLLFNGYGNDLMAAVFMLDFNDLI